MIQDTLDDLSKRGSCFILDLTTIKLTKLLRLLHDTVHARRGRDSVGLAFDSIHYRRNWIGELQGRYTRAREYFKSNPLCDRRKEFEAYLKSDAKD